MSAQHPNDRLLWLDTARGVGIVLVVIAHVWRGLESSGLLKASEGLTMLDNAIYSFHMPLFFFLAGLTIPRSLAAGRRRFLVGKINRIAYPFIIWSILVGGIMLAVGTRANNPISLGEVLLSPFIPIQQFWFLQALFVLQILAMTIGNSRALFVVSICTYIAAPVFFPFEGVFFNWLHFLLFLAGGAILVGYVRAFGRFWTLLAALGFFVSVWLGNASGQFYMAWIYLPAAVFGIALTIGISQQLAGSLLGRGFALLGRMSLTIYVAHILAASGLRLAMREVGLPFNPALYLSACTIAGIVLPVAMHIILQRLNLLWVFGLGSRSEPTMVAMPLPTPNPDHGTRTL